MQTRASKTKVLNIVLAVLVAGILSLGVSAITPEDAFAGTWKKDSVGWWYKNDNGSYPKNAWQKIGGKWYHFDKKGYMQTGWIKTGGKWYYLNANGKMATGWKQVDGKWYYLAGSGALKTGWVKSSGKWYYLNKSGAMVANAWQGNYYLQGDGSMATNKWIGKYHVDKNGKWDKTQTSQPSESAKTVVTTGQSTAQNTKKTYEDTRFARTIEERSVDLHETSWARIWIESSHYPRGQYTFSVDKPELAYIYKENYYITIQPFYYKPIDLVITIKNYDGQIKRVKIHFYIGSGDSSVKAANSTNYTQHLESAISWAKAHPITITDFNREERQELHNSISSFIRQEELKDKEQDLKEGKTPQAYSCLTWASMGNMLCSQYGIPAMTRFAGDDMWNGKRIHGAYHVNNLTWINNEIYYVDFNVHGFSPQSDWSDPDKYLPDNLRGGTTLWGYKGTNEWR